MRFGVVLPTYPGGATIDGFVRVAQAAEELGFASAWTTDHVIMTPEESGPYAEIFEGITTLAYLAGLTRTVTLGISVIVVPQRNGVILAKELATLARFAPGRLVVGVGAGWNENEFRMLDAGDRFRRRGAYLDETIGLWRHLWAKPHEPFRTEFFNLPAVAFAPLPDEGPAFRSGWGAHPRRPCGAPEGSVTLGILSAPRPTTSAASPRPFTRQQRLPVAPTHWSRLASRSSSMVPISIWRSLAAFPACAGTTRRLLTVSRSTPRPASMKLSASLGHRTARRPCGEWSGSLVG